MSIHAGVIPFMRRSPGRICVLTFCHFLSDFCPAIIPGFLPVAMAYFQLDLSLWVLILSTLSISCNLLQIPASKIGDRTQSPRWLFFGLLMLCMLPMLGLLPRTTPFCVLCLMMLVVSFGTAVIHPSGLRGVRNLPDVASSVATPMFMTGGFFGTSLAPWIGGLLVESFGLKGLLWLLPVLFTAMLAVRFSNLRLAKDETNPKQKTVSKFSGPWSFSALLWIGFLMNCGSNAFAGLVPYMLHVEKGFSLVFGGVTTTLFGVGSAVVSVLLGFLCRKYQISRILLIQMFCGVPIILLFFLFSSYSWSIIFALLAGALCSSPFPILVALSSTAPGGCSASMRMGLMVGGTWGMAGIAFLVIGNLASHFTAYSVLLTAVPLAYFGVAVTAFLSRRQDRPVAVI